ncbi:MAG TPA: KH domain-containing protein [Sporolactobacillaceae bacterium]|nr:KH domain-containing protein [Sporolactobacillaceae bacterium]
MDELIRTIVTPFVDHPEDIQVTKEQSGERTTYILSVNKEDMGKVIGKRGRTAQAIRHIVYAAGLAHHEQVSLSIQD